MFDCYGTLVDWREGIGRALDRMGIMGSAPERGRLFRSCLEEEQSIERKAYRSYGIVMTEAQIGAVHAAVWDVSRALAPELPETIPSGPLFPEARDILNAWHYRGARLACLPHIIATSGNAPPPTITFRSTCW